MSTIRGKYLKISLITLAGTLLFLSSLRVIYKYFPAPGVIALLLFAVYVLAIYFAYVGKPIFRNFVSNPEFISIVLAITFAAIYFAYPIADGLKAQMRGSDQDDCVILGAQRLIQGLFPYSIRSYYGNPCSPGPGMLILYLPFVYLNAYIIGAFTLLLTTLAALRWRSRSWLESGYFLFFLSMSFLWWELQVVGSDLIALGLGLVLVMTVLPSIVTTKNKISLVLIGVLIGLLSSTRANLFFIFPFLSFCIFWHWKNGAFLFFISALLFAAMPTLLFYSLNQTEFTPFHLFGKAGLLLPPIVFLSSVVLCGGLGVFGVLLARRALRYWAASLYLVLAPMLCILALADIWNRQWQWAQWEGANYLMPILPLSALLIIQFRKP